MGLRLFGNSSSRSNCTCGYCRMPTTPVVVNNYIEAPKLPNPDPTRWSILDSMQFGNYCVLKIHYPDCTNYEGVKILVFRSTLAAIKAQKAIDPHFGETKMLYPIARFQPTSEGWEDAVEYAKWKV